MIDLHSHILPEMDDGSACCEESMQLLAAIKSQGIDMVAATPHFYAEAEDPHRFLRRREASLAKLIAHDATTGGVEIVAGAEVLFYNGISQTELLPLLAIGKTGLLLLEMPFCTWPESYLSELVEIGRNTGLCVVLAHVDRYFRFQKPDVWEYLLQEGILLQANASAFLDRKVQKNVLRLLRYRKIHFVASDCHNMMQRPPKLDQAFRVIEKKLGREAMEWLDKVSHTFFDK